MSRFTSHLGLAVLEYSDGHTLRRDDSALWHHTEPLVWEQGAIGSGVFLVVPAFNPAGLTDAQLRLIEKRRAIAPGVTDLGSIPRPLRWFASPAGPGVKAFALHDMGYITQGWYGQLSRKDVDHLLHEALIAAGVTAGQALAIYEAVRVGGRAGWGS